MAQDSAKMSQDSAKMGQEGAKMPQDGAKIGQDGPRLCQDGPSCGQNCVLVRSWGESGAAPGRNAAQCGAMRRAHENVLAHLGVPLGVLTTVQLL